MKLRFVILDLRLFGIVVLIACAPAFADGPTTAPAEVPTVRIDSPFSLTEKVNDMVAEREKDPIGAIRKDMAGATDLLTRFNTSEPVQPQQKAILGSLDALIEMLEKQPKNAKAGSSPNPNNPLPDSAIVGGKLEHGAMRDPGVSTRMWGQLPPKQREQILQSQNEGFPAGYESILSSYYRRLAQENVANASGEGPAPSPGTATPAPAAAPATP